MFIFPRNREPKKTPLRFRREVHGLSNKMDEIYQLAFVMPGILPSEAISRRVIRERPNLR